MDADWRRRVLPEIVRDLAGKPGHEAVRVGVTRLIVDGLGGRVGDITHEHRMPVIAGRADALFANTVFEFKRDLAREMADVEARLPDYLTVRERELARPALGIATDGTVFIAYRLDAGRMVEIGRHKTNAEDPQALLAWLEPAVADRDDLPPEPLVIARELGRDSLTFRWARTTLAQMWADLAHDPEAALKRDLWNRLLREVYGEDVAEDRLFLQHSYLTIIAKTIAAKVFDLPVADAARILSGADLTDAGIHGAVEGDFFDWVLHHPDGAKLVLKLAAQTARFRLRDVQQDVMKALYESLMDPEQRRDLGEYYTPDWLAAKVTARAVERPLEQRVLDPACGSGTFLFHAIRRLRAAGAAAGWTAARRLAACMAQVRGLDVHPVAVIIARVTWLIALGEDIRERETDITVPVFLGDAMQWNIAAVADDREVRVEVPAHPPLRVPAGFAEDQVLLEAAVQAIRDGLEHERAPGVLERHFTRLPGARPRDVAAMVETYAAMLALKRAGRDGIWPFVLRNLVQPLALSRADQRADVLLGNPPWIAFRHLSAAMQARLRPASQDMNLWVGGKLATQQDMCALFTLRAAERYLKPDGMLAFVLPYAVLNRPAFAGLRRAEAKGVQLRWQEAWSLDEQVQPLFPVPACVMFGRRMPAGPLPARVRRFAGRLPMRDADTALADAALRVVDDAWPPMPSFVAGSPYRARFKQGATIVPRRFWFVELEATGRLGASRAAPQVRGRVGGQDKAPWKTLEPPRGPVEAEFLRKALLGENLAPFRLLQPALAVVPVRADGSVMDAKAAALAGHRRLAEWLGYCEAAWKLHSAQSLGGGNEPKLGLSARLDYQRGLSGQFPIPEIRVAYAASGTLFSACTVSEPTAVIEHKAYWAPARSMEEARYLTGLLNCGALRQRIADKQSKGQGGARDFDKLIWELPLPLFDARNPRHRAIAAIAVRCETLAAATPLPEGAYFTKQRAAIRAALDAAGLMRELDAAVEALLVDTEPQE